MKLESPSRFTSFYESFSDLIFATMAIFVLLLTVFLTMINPEGSQDQLEQKLEQAEKMVIEQSEKLSQAKFERDNAREQLEQLTSELAKHEESVQAQGLELVIAVDVSGSMGQALGHLVETITTISKTMPIISPDYRVGVVAYRDGPNDSKPYDDFPLLQIQPERKDGGNSFNRISSFLQGLKASNGSAPIGLAVDKAIDMMSSSQEYDGYQVFLLLGDVGPYENNLNDMWFSQAKKRHEKEITNKIASWVQATEKRRVISMFSGTTPDPSWQREYHVNYRESLRFFKEVATASGQPENFTQNPGKMLAYLLNAIVTR